MCNTTSNNLNDAAPLTDAPVMIKRMDSASSSSAFTVEEEEEEEDYTVDEEDEDSILKSDAVCIHFDGRLV
jgi:hypothetical protein